MPERGSTFGLIEEPDISDDRLDALEARAFEAWRTWDADGQSSAHEVDVDEVFVDRVMSALEASQPRLVLLDTPPPTTSRPWLRRATSWGVAAAAAALVVAIASWPTAQTATDKADHVPIGAELEMLVTASGPDSIHGDGETDAVAAASLPADFDHDVESYIGAYGRNYGPAFHFHGVIVVARGGKVAYSRSFGVANPDTGDPNTASTRFRLGLLTEPVTATAILQLAEDGVLDVDDPLSRYVPQFPRASQITIRDLLTHRSGIPNYTDDPSFHVWKSQPHTTEQMLDRFSPWPLEFEPGTDVLPSNSNYILLGAVIERVTEQAYADFVQARIFTPAGMTDSRFGDDFTDGRQAIGNVWNDDEQLDPPGPLDMSTFGAAGGIVSTPTDMVRFDRALRNGTLLSDASRRMMNEADDSGYGLGWVVTRAYGDKLLSFPGAIDGYSGAMLHFVDHETTVLVLANTEVVPGNIVAQDVALMLYGDAPPRRNEPVEIKIAPGTYHKYVGTWGLSVQTLERYADLILPERADLLREVYVQQQEDRLYFHVPGHARTWMHPMGNERFFFKDHSGNQVSFELGDDRRAAKLFVHNGDHTFELSRRAPSRPAPKSPGAPVAP